MPLQKSFSDTNHGAKSRQPSRGRFNRNRSYQGPQSMTSNPPSRPLQEKPHIPVSTASKNKLSAFQFSGQKHVENKGQNVTNVLSNDEKENEALTRPIESCFSSERKPARETATDESTGTLSEQPALPELPRRDIPSTRASRLALPDLIGMTDVRQAVENISPDERIEWDHNKDMVRSSASSSIRRAKKRARSSSPMTSSPVEVSKILLGKGELSNSPVDPGSELWGRYSLSGSNKTTPQGLSLPALAHFMHTSSPQTSKQRPTPRSASGYRRANSCGNQFPKRRRITRTNEDDVFIESANIGPSKLSVLLEKVQEGMANTNRTPTPNESQRSSRKSSTTPRADTEDISSVQNTEPDVPILASALLQCVDQPRLIHERTSRAVSPQPSLDCNSSDYGDFDDDLDVSLMETDGSFPRLSKATHSKVSPDSNPQAHATSTHTHLDATAVKVSQPLKSKPASEPFGYEAVIEDDEFPESDEELFSASLDQVTSNYDQQNLLAGSPSLVMNSRISGPQRSIEKLKAVSEDEFEDDGLDDSDFAAVEAIATQSIRQSASSLLPSTQKARAIQRYLVTNILENEYTTVDERKQHEKILLLQIETTKTVKMVHLRGTWMSAPVGLNAFVHVIGSFKNGRCIIDDDHNILIVHPDHLISTTVLADSFGCTRRAVLQARLKSTSDSNAPLLYGTILHEIFQAAMLANRWDAEWLNELIGTVATNHLESLYAIKLQIPDAVEYLQSKMPVLQSWAELFVTSNPKPEAKVQTGHGKTAQMCVNKLLDVEEHVWSPMYGLKGNIDATVQIKMEDGDQQRTLTVPFEFKTGKNPTIAHRAQTALYNLLLSDRYDVEIAYGILYYLETSDMIRVPTVRRELLHMIMQRNELACFVRERHTELPPMLKKQMCEGCYAKVPCFIYHKIADDGNGDTSGMKAKFDDIVKHITPKHKEFFLKWDGLLTKEEKEGHKFRRELWTMLGSEREKLGRCFSSLSIEPGSASEDQASSKINRYHYSMVKDQASADFSFKESQIIVGEPIVISDEKGHFALANGFVTHVRKRRITVAVDRRLHNARIRQPGFDESDNQVFASIMEVAQEGSTAKETGEAVVENPVKYRLDKDEFSNGMASIRNTLIQIMTDGPFGSRHIRGLVVDLNAPRFKTQSSAYTLKDRENINVDQRRAIQKVMSAQDYALVLGMPGTGKTTTIAHIIRALVSQGKSVLLTSYTHSAVDNILLKLKNDDIPMLRLGTVAKIHREVQEFATLAATTKNSFEEIRSAWHDTPVVATTCLGINHAIFSERTFDYCIVDEASQITLPVCLGPIRLSKTFILVGDHNQLPPIIQNEEARKGGLDVSLFKHLSDMHPSSVVYLEHQYRMCEDVMALSNNLIYNGRLKCGSREVAVRSITIPDMDGLQIHHFSPSTLSRSQKSICPGPNRGTCWLRELVDPQTKVAFVNTDPLLPLSREQAKGNLIVNPTETAICVQLVESLLSIGVPASSIGVMTHYRSQLAQLGDSLRAHRDIEMHTADRFQGRDKEVIILSLVRSNEAKSIGELLKDWRRINVAFTRAKTKLLVIGSRETLKGKGPNANGEEEMVARFVKFMEVKNWVFELPKNAIEQHSFDVCASQITASAASRATGTQQKGAQVKLQTGTVHKGSNFDAGDKENTDSSRAGGNSNRKPNKKILGQKPFKIPRMSVLGDIVNEALG